MRIHLLSITAALTAATAIGIFSGAATPAETASAQSGLPYRVFLGQIVRDGTNAVNQAGFVTSATAIPGRSDIEIRVKVRAREPDTVVVDVETYDSVGRRIDQQWVDNLALKANEDRTFTVRVPKPANASRGPFTVKVGIFEPGPYWGLLLHWNNAATTFAID